MGETAWSLKQTYCALIFLVSSGKIKRVSQGSQEINALPLRWRQTIKMIVSALLNMVIYNTMCRM